MIEVGAHKIFNGAIIAVLGRRGYGRGQGPIIYFAEPALLWMAGTIMGEVGPIIYFTEPALLWLACTVGAHKMFHGASITVVGWHGYGRGPGP